MTRIMYDADDPRDIPRDAGMVAGYVDGSRTTWRTEWWGWFPQAELVTISAVGIRWDADVLDVEPGNIWPPENVLPVVVTARANGYWPAVYCNQINHWEYIRNMFRMRGMEEPPYIVANYDGIAVIPAGAIGKQYKHPPQIGKHYDLSVIDDSWIPGHKETDDVNWNDPITRVTGDTFPAGVRLAWANYYAGESARDSAAALAVVKDVARVVNVIAADLADGVPGVDVDAIVARASEEAALKAKRLIGKDLTDEETNSGG